MPGGHPVRVLLVDDHPLVLSGLELLLGAQVDLVVVASAHDGRGALRAAMENHIDVAVVDLGLPDMDGEELCRRLLLARPTVRVVVLTMHGDDARVRSALAAGASGYVLKGSDPDNVLDTIRRVAHGDLVIAAGVRSAVTAAFTGSGPERVSTLSNRELQVLHLLGQGRTTTDIARRLAIAPKTVRNRLSDVFAKIGVRDRVSAVLVAREAGLGGPGDRPPDLGSGRR